MKKIIYKMRLLYRLFTAQRHYLKLMRKYKETGCDELSIPLGSAASVLLETSLSITKAGIDVDMKDEVFTAFPFSIIHHRNGSMRSNYNVLPELLKNREKVNGISYRNAIISIQGNHIDIVMFGN